VELKQEDGELCKEQVVGHEWHLDLSSESQVVRLAL